jgi:regulator of replication initiation timing
MLSIPEFDEHIKQIRNNFIVQFTEINAKDHTIVIQREKIERLEKVLADWKYEVFAVMDELEATKIENTKLKADLEEIFKEGVNTMCHLCLPKNNNVCPKLKNKYPNYDGITFSE